MKNKLYKIVIKKKLSTLILSHILRDKPLIIKYDKIISEKLDELLYIHNSNGRYFMQSLMEIHCFILNIWRGEITAAWKTYFIHYSYLHSKIQVMAYMRNMDIDCHNRQGSCLTFMIQTMKRLLHSNMKTNEVRLQRSISLSFDCCPRNIILKRSQNSSSSCGKQKDEKSRQLC